MSKIITLSKLSENFIMFLIFQTIVQLILNKLFMHKSSNQNIAYESESNTCSCMASSENPALNQQWRDVVNTPRKLNRCLKYPKHIEKQKISVSKIRKSRQNKDKIKILQIQEKNTKAQSINNRHQNVYFATNFPQSSFQHHLSPTIQSYSYQKHQTKHQKSLQELKFLQEVKVSVKPNIGILQKNYNLPKNGTKIQNSMIYSPTYSVVHTQATGFKASTNLFEDNSTRKILDYCQQQKAVNQNIQIKLRRIQSLQSIQESYSLKSVVIGHYPASKAKLAINKARHQIRRLSDISNVLGMSNVLGSVTQTTQSIKEEKN